MSKLSLLFQRARAFPDAFCFYWAPICIHCSPPDLVIYMQILMPSLKKPNPCYLQSRLQLCLEISISLNSRNLLQFLQFSYSVTELLYTVKEKGVKPDRKPYPLPYGLRNPYRNLKSENSQDYAQKPQRNCMVYITMQIWGCIQNGTGPICWSWL